MFPNTALNSISPDVRMLQAFPNIFFSVVLPDLTCCQIAHIEELSPRLLPIPHMSASERALPHMQRDMKWDVTCCTVTFPEQFSILMAEEVHELLSPCVRKRPHP